jgi:hypothetical protein
MPARASFAEGYTFFILADPEKKKELYAALYAKMQKMDFILTRLHGMNFRVPKQDGLQNELQNPQHLLQLHHFPLLHGAACLRALRRIMRPHPTGLTLSIPSTASISTAIFGP